MHGQHSSIIMCELEWINIASKSLAYCAQLLQQIKQLKEKFERLQEEAARLKTLLQKQEQLVQDLTERHGGTTPSTKLEHLLRKVQPRQFASYQEFIRALMIETLSNTSMTFDQLNYDLFALNREVFHQVNRETTAFFRLLTNKQQCLLPDGPTTSQDQY